MYVGKNLTQDSRDFGTNVIGYSKHMRIDEVEAKKNQSLQKNTDFIK